MAAPVDICNLALGHLGDDAQVASISPPDQTAQAIHCARYYPIARDSLLEMHPWGFSTKRVTLAQINATVPANAAWSYAYGLPADFLSAIAVQSVSDSDDGYMEPTPFTIEADPINGSAILFTDQPTALLRYTSLVTDSERFSPLFVETLSWMIAAKIAGPIIKGSEGRAASAEANRMALFLFKQAAISDSNDRRVRIQEQSSWMNNR